MNKRAKSILPEINVIHTVVDNLINTKNSVYENSILLLLYQKLKLPIDKRTLQNKTTIPATISNWRNNRNDNNSILVMQFFGFQITKYGTIEDYRETKVISIRRQNLRRHVLTMAMVITDSNETRKHLDDRLFVSSSLFPLIKDALWLRQ